jgi:phosphoglycerate dehydrogenase-like enzyme
MDNVLVLFETNSAFREELRSILNGYRIIFNENINSIDRETAGNTVIIFGNPKIDFLKTCPNLKWLQLQTAGADNYVKELDKSVLLTCASGGYGHAVSEHMLGLTFELLKKLHLYRDEQSAGRWQNRGKVKSIQGAVVLVVGLGDIGGEYARRMKALGAYVIGVRRVSHAKPDYVDELLLPHQMEEALPRADVVALAVPETANTIGLIGRSQLAKMKNDAVIINAGRGSAIDTEALCDALESNALGGAGLDVTDPEPLAPGHKLWKLENAVITPHVAGGRYMNETGQYIMKLNLENARRFVNGEILENIVDYETGYRYSKGDIDEMKEKNYG